VNEALARKYFPGENPIGKRIKILSAPGTDPPWLAIVGVAANEKDQNFFRPMSWEETPAVFVPIKSRSATPCFVGISRGNRQPRAGG
jgi:hypothetical protein